MITLSRKIIVYLLVTLMVLPSVYAGETPQFTEYTTVVIRAQTGGEDDDRGRRQPQGIVIVRDSPSQRVYFYFCNDFVFNYQSKDGGYHTIERTVKADVSRCEMLGERENGYTKEEFESFGAKLKAERSLNRWMKPAAAIVAAVASIFIFKGAKHFKTKGAATMGGLATIPFFAVEGYISSQDWELLTAAVTTYENEGNYAMALGSNVDIIDVAEDLEKQLWEFDHCRNDHYFGFVCRDNWDETYQLEDVLGHKSYLQ